MAAQGVALQQLKVISTRFKPIHIHAAYTRKVMLRGLLMVQSPPTKRHLQVTGYLTSASHKVAGLQVVGARQTGWTAATGTALLGAFNANQAYTVSAAYTQAEIQALAAGLVQVRQRNKALEDLLRTHGLMN